ncbi:MAG: N-acetyltransferase [Nitrospiraceae bacterium]|jgi:amino-acid N-acetyltransferase|nr:N-acetyltransferase [Nitrospiraceae bacterium]
MPIRKARIADVKAIQSLVNDFAKREQMLPRSLNELYESVRDFIVYEDQGHIIGVCALRIMWDDLGEIRSLAVRPQDQKKGIGKQLVKRCLKEAKEIGLQRVFALTYQPFFFKKLGFHDVDKAKLPQKIWSDCIKCHKFPECDEHAVILSLKTES